MTTAGQATQPIPAPDLPYPFLSPLTRGPRGDTTRRVEGVLRDSIVNFAFQPGEFIRKDAICERLGVSRFPVSEALGRLAEEGFVEILPQRGTRVSRIDIAACRTAMFLRRAIEGEAMRVIAPLVDNRLVERLETNLWQQDLAVRQSNALEFFRQDHVFHDQLLSELSYRRVTAIVGSARRKLDQTREFLLRMPDEQLLGYLDHVAIVNALKRRDADAAQRAMIHHLDRFMQVIELAAAGNPDIFAPAA
jgi:DNA-binding GntR family transcriptional regulator